MTAVGRGSQRVKPKVLVIGGLPPPLIGPTLAMKRLLKAENIRARFDILVLDISDVRTSANIGKFDFTNAWLAIKHILQCCQTVLFERPALVYLNLSEGLWGYLRDVGLVIPALLMQRKIVFHLRGSQFRSFYETMPLPCRWLTRAILQRVSRVIVLGQNLRPLFIGLVAENRIAIVPNGIDYRQFDKIEKTGSPKSLDRLLYLSNLKKEKGTLRMIEALPEIVKRCPTVHITFAGEWQSHADRNYAEEFIQKNDLARHITFAGQITDLDKIRLYKEHDLFVFTPVDPEGLPWVILEAMSAGLPVISSDRGAIAEVVQDGRTGLMIEPRPKDIADKVLYLIEHPNEAITMGLNGRRRVERYFSEPAYLKGIEQVLLDAIEST